MNVSTTLIAEGMPIGGAVDSDPLCIGLSPAKATKLYRLARWITKGGLAITEQGLISGSNFVMGILLARWIPSDQYGAYATAFAIFLLLSLLYQSVLLEPMAVFGGASYRNCLRGYLGSLLWIHLAIAVIVFVLLGASAGLARALGQGSGLPGALAGVTIAAPCVLLSWLARRGFYLKFAPGFATAGALAYSVLVIGGILLVNHLNRLTPFTAFVLMALAAFSTSIVLLFRLRSHYHDTERAPTLHKTWQRHWDYGKWALGASVVAWIPAYIYYPVVSSFSGMSRAGELRALLNFVLPLTQAYGALSVLLLPYAARVNELRGGVKMRALTRNYALLFIAGTLAYWSVLIPFRQTVFHLLYAGRYMNVAYLLPLFALGSIFWSAALGPVIVLRAMEAPNSVFRAHSAATIISLAVGIPATWFWDLRGVGWALVLSSGVVFLVSTYMVFRRSAVATRAS